MLNKELIEKIKKKKEYSEIPDKDVLMILEKYRGTGWGEEELIKKARNKLHKMYSSTVSRKILNSNILNKKTNEEILKKHLSTMERFENYNKIYEKLFFDMSHKSGMVSVIDLGAGINGLSFNFLKKHIKGYIAVEAVGQLVNLTNEYFEKAKIPNGKAVHESLFSLNKIKKIIEDSEGPKVVFLFKVLDSLEMLERNYSKRLIKEILPLSERIIVSFATESFAKRKKFNVTRKWFEEFLEQENVLIKKDFEISGERYIILEQD